MSISAPLLVNLSCITALVFPLQACLFLMCRKWKISLLTYRLHWQTEKARHLLAVREKLRDLRRASVSRDLSKPDKDQNNELRRRCSKDDADAECDDVIVTSDSTSSMTLSSDRQQQLVVKCVKLLTQKHFLDVATNQQVRLAVGTLVHAHLVHYTFRVSRRRLEMCIGHARLCVCLSVCLSVCASLHAHTTAQTRM